MVHRDLKPANIKLGEGDMVKVLDFGLAKAVKDGNAASPADMTQRGVILGTPSYMAPEQALGGPADRRSDVWSFGVVLAEMLSGRKIFSGSTTSEILGSIVRGEPDLSGIRPEWLPLLERCLTKDVRRRLQAIGEARIALEDGFKVETIHHDKNAKWLWIAIAAVLIVYTALLWKVRAPAPPLESPLANATFTRLADYEGTHADASISPDGKFVGFLSDRGGLSHVWLDQIGIGTTVDLTPGPDDWRRPLRSIGFSREGAEIWVAGTNKRRLLLLPLLGGKPRLFLNDRAVSPVGSPDGAKVAYHTSEPGTRFS